MSVSFINRGMKHPYAYFNDNQPVPYADNLYFRKLSRINEIFDVGQYFGAKFKLKTKIIDFHIQRYIQLEVANNSKSNMVMKCKDLNCPWRLFATPNITGVWEIRTNPLEHSCCGSATRVDHNQMTVRIIADIIKNRLRKNLKMIVKEARCLIRQIFPTVEISYNKIRRGRKLTIIDLFGS
jgi:hypothetical protein